MMAAAAAGAFVACLAGYAPAGPEVRAGSSTMPAAGEPEISVAVDGTPLGAEVPADFLGLSFEIPPLDEGEFAPGHPVLARLLQNLGPGVLRFGGNSLDRSAWAPSGTFAGAVSAVTPDDLARMFEFTRRIGWKVLLGLDLGHFDPTAAAAEAVTAARFGESTLDAFEFGNEPDLYTRVRPNTAPLRPGSYGVSEYLREWQIYLQAVRAGVPGAPVVGPDIAGSAGGVEMLRHLLAAHGTDLKYATAHYYMLGATITDPRAPRYASIANLLSPVLLAAEGGTIGRLVEDVTRSGLALRLGETNSIFGGGRNGVSDTFAGALWTADYLFRVAKLGVIGVNLHGTLDHCGSYSPICAASRALAQADTLQVQPNYYAMLLFHLAARGRFAPVRITGSARVTGYPTLSEDGTFRLALINFGPETVIARIAIPGGHRTGSVIRLSGPALEATSGVTLAGSSVAADGTWAPGPPEPASIAYGTMVVKLPPTTATVVSTSAVITGTPIRPITGTWTEDCCLRGVRPRVPFAPIDTRPE